MKKEEVIIHYDAQLIPHLFAQNDLDLYRAQGYITAKHRLWQMEFQTHGAAGRISEIIGEVALNYDRGERRKGMVFGAEQALIKMKEDPKTAEFVEAYAQGVNDYIDQLDPKRMPIEYKLLDYEPEQWTSKKTALLLMLMTKDLALSDYDLERTNALRIFGKERFEFLFPDYLDAGAPVIPKESDWSFIDVPITETPAAEMILDSISKVKTSEEDDKPLEDVVLREVNIIKVGVKAKAFDAANIFINHFAELERIEKKRVQKEQALLKATKKKFDTQQKKSTLLSSGLQFLVTEKGTGEKIKAGMIFTIEPMINQGRKEVKVLKDNWTAVTIDGKISAHYEHSILITEDECIIFTAL